MTDNTQWHAPGAQQPAPATPAAWQQTPPGYGAAPGWTPPPKPGLIPLHPLSLGTIIGSSFRVMRRNPAPTFGLSVLLYGFVTIVYAVVVGGVFAYSFSRIATATSGDQGTIIAGTYGLIGLASIVPVTLVVVATAILQGIISLEVARATLGEKLRIRGLWKLARGRIASLLGWAAILTAAIVVYLIVAIIAIAAMVAFAATASSVSGAVTTVIVTVLVGIVVTLGVIVLAAWLSTKLVFVPTAIMLERLTLRAAMKRSWSLTRGSFWRIFGIQLLISLIVNVGSSVVSTPISLIGGVAAAVINPNNDAGTLIATYVVLYAVIGILSIITGAVGLVMQSASVALLYIDIRMRKEGLDLELLHYVEAKQAGTPGVGNPYERTAGFAAAEPAHTGSPWG